MKRLYSIIALMIVGVVILWLSPLYVKCDSDPLIVIVNPQGTEESNITNTINDINEKLKDKEYDKFLAYQKSGNDIEITLKMSLYTKLDQKPRQEAMTIMLNGITNSNISAMNRTKIYNFIAGSDEPVSSLVRQLNDDVRADYAKAYGLFQPFTGVIGTILGVITLLIFVLLTITILVDISYLTIPAFNAFLHKANENEKPKFVSLEAWKAEMAAENDKGTRHESLSIYMKLKFKQFIAIGICLLYLVSGQIYDLIASIIDYFRGILPN